MEPLPKLTPTQALLLRAAARRADGRVIPPDGLRAGARASTLAGLLKRGWIEPVANGHAITDAGYAAIGRQRPAPPDAVQKLDTTDATTPRHAGISGKKKGPETIRALVIGGTGGNRTPVRKPSPDGSTCVAV